MSELEQIVKSKIHEINQDFEIECWEDRNKALGLVVNYVKNPEHVNEINKIVNEYVTKKYPRVDRHYYPKIERFKAAYFS